jgi:alpha-galactosidase
MPISSREHIWVLETRQVAYGFGLDPGGMLLHYYWGARLPRLADYPSEQILRYMSSFDVPANQLSEEYPAYGGLKYNEPCLKASFSDGTRDVVWQFVAAETPVGEHPQLVIRLKDPFYPLAVALHYRVYEAYDLIERWVVLNNFGDTPILLERAWSALWHLPAGSSYRLTHLQGKWAGEFQPVRDLLQPGVKVLESRRLTSSHQHNPWFALDAGAADEENGEVWFGALAWSGNWKLAAEVTNLAATRLGIGLSDWDFAWQLAPGETFTTPACIGGYSAAGFGAASRTLHDFIRQQVLPHGRALHKVLYNSWEATLFDVDVAGQTELASLAAEMGVELFVMDDGWFHGRHSDNAGLGDWRPDEGKFPDGLGPLIRRVNELGMDFGLWLEPEMVNPDSDLYRAHPDWVIHFPGRQRSEARNQLILNLARLDVQDYLIDVIDDLLSHNNIAFIKWDMNRNVSEPGWPAAEREQRELWVRYVYGLYRVWGELRLRHPNVVWQGCSGGGGRSDLGILRLADQVWVSDNTDPLARLAIQEGFSLAYPANVMEAWVTDMGASSLPFEFRMHASMCGVLGIGGHLARWEARRRSQAAKWIAIYKEIRPIIQYGDLYRLRSALAHPFSALQYMAKDGSEGVLFAFRTHLPEPVFLPPLRLRGLQPEALYRIEGEGLPRSGAAWMQLGLSVSLGDFQSAVKRIWRVSEGN